MSTSLKSIEDIDINTFLCNKDMGDSPEVGPLEILRVSFLLGNGQAPSDIPSDTKNSIRVVH